MLNSPKSCLNCKYHIEEVFVLYCGWQKAKGMSDRIFAKPSIKPCAMHEFKEKDNSDTTHKEA